MIFCAWIFHRHVPGYVVGLMQSFMLLEHMEGKKVLLCTGETFCRGNKEKQEPPYYRAPFGGEAANITIVENAGNEKVYYEFHRWITEKMSSDS